MADKIWRSQDCIDAEERFKHGITVPYTEEEIKKIEEARSKLFPPTNINMEALELSLNKMIDEEKCKCQK